MERKPVSVTCVVWRVHVCVAGCLSVVTPLACKSTSAPSVVTPPSSSTSALSCGSISAEFDISASHSLGKFIITIRILYNAQLALLGWVSFRSGWGKCIPPP